MKKYVSMLPVLLISTITYAQKWSEWFDRDAPGGNGDKEMKRISLNLTKALIVGAAFFHLQSFALAPDSGTVIDEDQYQAILEEYDEMAERLGRYEARDEIQSLEAELNTNSGIYFHMNERDGTALNDDAGEVNSTGYLVGPSINRFVDGASLGGINFDASNYVSVDDDDTIDIGTDDLSIFVWIKTNSNGSQTILDKRVSNGSGYHLYLYQGHLLLHLSTSQGWTNYYSMATPTVGDNQWHHVGATVDRDNPTGGNLYMDGKVIHRFSPTARSGSLQNNAKLLIGKHQFASSYFNGVMDELVITNSVLNEDRIDVLSSKISTGNAKTGWGGAELNITRASGTSIEFTYVLPTTGSSYDRYEICFTELSVYENDACADPTRYSHNLSRNDPSGEAEIINLKKNTMYYFTLGGFETVNGKQLYGYFVSLSHKTGGDVTSNDKVWIDEKSSYRAHVNWKDETGEGPIKICWKRTGSLRPICSEGGNVVSISDASLYYAGGLYFNDLKPDEEYKVRVEDKHKKKIGVVKFKTDKAPEMHAHVAYKGKYSITMAWSAQNRTYPTYHPILVCWKKAWSLKEACNANNSGNIDSMTTQYEIGGLDKNTNYKINVYGYFGHDSNERIRLFEDRVKTNKK